MSVIFLSCTHVYLDGNTRLKRMLLGMYFLAATNFKSQKLKGENVKMALSFVVEMPCMEIIATRLISER